MALKDSGERREFTTGAVRDMAAGKGRYDLIPYDPLRRLALIYEDGAIKYGVHNWQKGIPVASFIDSGMRHLQKFAADLTDEDHAAQAVWNIFAAMWTLDQIKQGKLSAALDDRAYKITELPKLSFEPQLEPWPNDGDTFTISTDTQSGDRVIYIYRNGNWDIKGE